MEDFEITAGVEDPLEKADLEGKVKAAEQRMKARPKAWRPEVGEIKAIELLRIEERESDKLDRNFEVFILKDLQDSQVYSLPVCGLLRKHLQEGQQYVLRYGGKVEAQINGQIREVHQWDWEQVK